MQTRVSGAMTNAPFMLNVDCDTFANNPKIVLHAMCCFLGLKPQDCAFVQFPQDFYNQLKDDPFATNMAAAVQVNTITLTKNLYICLIHHSFYCRLVLLGCFSFSP